MFRKNIKRAAAQFANQFTLEDGNLVYRKNNKGPAIPVNHAEKDHFIATFKRAYYRGFWAMMAGVMALVIVAVSLAIATGQDDPTGKSETYFITLPVIAVVAAFAWYIFHIWHAPTRALQNRTPWRNALDRREHSRQVLANTGWPTFLLIPVGAVFIVVRFYNVSLRWHQGWNPFVILISAVLLAVFALRAWQKYQLGKP